MNKEIISVIGSGTMGNGIAHVFSTCNIIRKVILVCRQFYFRKGKVNYRKKFR